MKDLRAVSLLLFTGAALVACGPSTRIETSNGMGGAGGSNVAEGGSAGSNSSGTSSAGTPTLMQIDLGQRQMNVLHGFDVPEHALGATAIVEAPTPTDVVGISRFRTPSNEFVTFDFAVAGKTTQVFANQSWIGGGILQSDLPQAWPVQAGSWRILLGSNVDIGPAHVRMWIRKTVDGKFHGGVIDVNVLNTSSKVPPSYIEYVIGNLFNDYAGLGLGNVTHLKGDAAFSVIDTYEQYRALLTTSAGIKATPAVNIFVIDTFGSDFSSTIGLAGGIPGSATVHGTTMSGVAYMPSGNPDTDVIILKHEIGHLAGLFHTTEFAIEGTDPITDTIECPVETIQADPKQCPDITNLMFPMAEGGTELTVAQKRVIQGSALYRGVWAAGDSPDPPLSAVASKPSYETEASALAFEYEEKLMPTNPTPVEWVLGTMWCAHGQGDYEALAIRVAGASAVDTLRSIALDETRAALLRGRALAAYVRVAQGHDRVRALDLAEELARDTQRRTRLRTAALNTLTRFDVARAKSVSVVLSATTNPVVRQLSERVLAK